MEKLAYFTEDILKYDTLRKGDGVSYPTKGQLV